MGLRDGTRDRESEREREGGRDGERERDRDREGLEDLYSLERFSRHGQVVVLLWLRQVSKVHQTWVQLLVVISELEKEGEEERGGGEERGGRERRRGKLLLFRKIRTSK